MTPIQNDPPACAMVRQKMFNVHTLNGFLVRQVVSFTQVIRRTAEMPVIHNGVVTQVPTSSSLPLPVNVLQSARSPSQRLVCHLQDHPCCLLREARAGKRGTAEEAASMD